MLHSTITSKGQVTIPAQIRNKFHISSGSKLEFLSKEDYIVIIPMNKSLKNLKGALPKPDFTLSCEEMDEIIQNRT